jgi:hypothetical protein
MEAAHIQSRLRRIWDSVEAETYSTIFLRCNRYAFIGTINLDFAFCRAQTCEVGIGRHVYTPAHEAELGVNQCYHYAEVV